MIRCPAPRHETFLPYAAFALLGLVVFSRGFGSEFVFDSPLVVADDIRLKEFSFQNLGLIFTRGYWWPTFESDLYRPLTTLSFFIEKTVLGFGKTPVAYQFVNLLLHIAVCCGAYSLLRRWGMPALAAWGASTWLLIHPYAVEVVPNVVGRSDLLAMGAILGALHLHQRWVESDREGGHLIVLWTLVLCLGCFAKESAFSGLAISLWYAATQGREAFLQKWSRLKRPGLSAALLCVGALLVTLTVLVPKGVLRSSSEPGIDLAGDNPLVALSFVESRVNALTILGDNLVNALIPYRVSADYSYSQLHLASLPPAQGLDWLLLGAALATLGLGLWCALEPFRRHRPASLPAFLLGAAFLSLMPTANLLVQIGTIRADRLVYPAIFFFAAAALCVFGGLRRRLPASTFPPLVASVAAAGLCVAVFTHFRAVDWRTNRQFWESVYASAPNSYKAKLGYGTALVKEGKIEQAREGLTLIEAAIVQVANASWSAAKGATILSYQMAGGAWMEYAQLERAAGRDQLAAQSIAKAEAHLWKAVKVLEEIVEEQSEKARETGVQTKTTLVALAECLRFRGAPLEAVELLQRNAKTNRFLPDYLAAHGWALADAGRPAEAKSKLFTALLLDPTNQMLSREVRWFLDRGDFPPSQRPLRTDDERDAMKTAPLLSLSSPATWAGLELAAAALESELLEDGRKGEAVRLQRSLHSLRRGAAVAPSAGKANSSS